MASTILITGANRGIGFELTQQYAEAGWRVIACCREPEKAQALDGVRSDHGEQVSIHRLDVTKSEPIKALVTSMEDTPIDILLNNAGIYGQRDASLGNIDEDRWLETFRVNTIAPIKVMETFIDVVAASKRKVFATITSKMGSIADNTSGGSYVYRSSKAALNAAMKSAANDLEGRGISVVVIHPGWVQTDMGGPSALLSVEQSAKSIRELLGRVSIEDTGKFFNYDGTVIPW
ncbi:MAG: SDR family oxidoreductase [Proteobacteria bacterium]|nr:MAG: SDR family oxidoreductase [Pseudomonadota bacterium]